MQNVMNEKITGVGFTFDDLLLVPAKSEVLPTHVQLHTRLTKNIRLNIPIVSAAMDRVTDSKLAIALARQGGIGIIHKNFSAENQADEVDRVKRSESGLINNPVTTFKDNTVQDALDIMKKYKISGVPITDKDNTLIGIITNRDIRFVTDYSVSIDSVMTKKNLITAPKGTSIDEAKNILSNYKVEKLLIVDENYKLTGLFTIKDIDKIKKYPNSCKDEKGRLRVGAAVSTSPDCMERVELLVKAGIDVLVIDSAHGHHIGIIQLVKKVRYSFPELEIIAGNVATGEATNDLISAGASAVKVGIGPGSICTTRVIAGVGVPQLSAIMNCYTAAREHDTPVIADGGIRFTGDITKALAAGASTVMLGNLLAGLEESPGDLIYLEGRQYKEYRGMGSLEAMREGGGSRYFQDALDTSKLVPEGIVGRIPYKGRLGEFVYQLLGGLRAGMGYLGAGTIQDLQEYAKFVQVTASGVRESHPHDIQIVREAPNYWLK
ncbi:MAG TPA: IMP dehydrogenase [Caldisericia bacterium]|nr:IMP dehydrogenase [Caldisericia bacterium]